MNTDSEDHKVQTKYGNDRALLLFTFAMVYVFVIWIAKIFKNYVEKTVDELGHGYCMLI